jgi:hypothetical protein
MGACDAALAGVPVVTTGFGGQVECLKAALFVSYTETKPFMCIPLASISHEPCLKNDGGQTCLQNPWFQPDQHWAEASVTDGSQILKFAYDEYDICKGNALITKTFISKFRDSKSVTKEFAKIL